MPRNLLNFFRIFLIKKITEHLYRLMFIKMIFSPIFSLTRFIYRVFTTLEKIFEQQVYKSSHEKSIERNIFPNAINIDLSQ